ncbi:hypothetical protein EAE99_007751 [Botrytis elliptica]|nr:hypothetical protein EAE99_007751 [Botrytis elliptica]
MSQTLDHDLHYSEGDTNKSIERDDSDGSLRCPLFVQDTTDLIDEDGNTWVGWVDDEEWEKEQTARRNALRTSRFASSLAALFESSKDTPIVTDTLVAMPSETAIADIASVPSTSILTSINVPLTEENFPSQAVLDPEPDTFNPVVSSGEEHPRPFLDSDTESGDYDDSGDECNLHSEPGDNEESLNTDKVEATPSIPLNNTLAIAFNQGSVEQFTDTVWFLIGKILFAIGVCVWLIVPEKLKDTLKARYADYLASGAGSRSTVVEQEAHSEEDKNQNSSENDAAVPHDGHGMDYLDYLECMESPDYINYLDCMESPDYVNYLDYLDDVDDDSSQESEEEISSFAKTILAELHGGEEEYKDDYAEEAEEAEEEEEEAEQDQSLAARFHRIVIKAWDYLIEKLGSEWALANRSTCYRYINKIWRRWVVHARINRGRGNIWGVEIPYPPARFFTFVEKCPRDLRISKYSGRRSGGRFERFRLLFYRG